ncbi:hypothetical protein FPT15_04210 [Pseudomonas sp. RGB]|nr:hypothetical protein FPT15_04210 [Pseudomonas sp. RGB]
MITSTSGSPQSDKYRCQCGSGLACDADTSIYQ